jgi:HSP20 family protein
MAILDWSFNPALSIEREFDRLRRQMDDVFGRMKLGTGFAAGFPAMNIYDQGDDVVVAVQAPGVLKENLTVDLRENTLTVTGKRLPASYPDANLLREECAYGEFKRTLRINSRVENEKIEAKLKNGILFVTMPKMEAAKPKQIAINA